VRATTLTILHSCEHEQRCTPAGAENEDASRDVATGVAATIGIALASGFAAVYTEKVIKSQQKHSVASFDRTKYSLAYMQVQLASMSLLVMGVWALVKDFDQIKVRECMALFDVPTNFDLLDTAGEYH